MKTKIQEPPSLSTDPDLQKLACQNLTVWHYMKEYREDQISEFEAMKGMIISMARQYDCLKHDKIKAIREGRLLPDCIEHDVIMRAIGQTPYDGECEHAEIMQAITGHD